MKRPDFFIVGAFKAGTTAMYEYLRAHPQIFMSVPKEPMYFGADLTPRYRRMTEDEYLALFKAAADAQRAGEASPWYLYSKQAPREILAFEQDARAIVLLRNPVDVMYAQHSQLVFNEREDIIDFGETLAAEEERRRGERIPADALRPEALYYRHSVRFADQLRHWIEVFGRERMHTIVFDDLVADPRTVYRETLEFLRVDPTHEVDLSVYNPNRRARSGAIQRLIFAPPRPLRALFGRLRSLPIAHRLRDRLVSANSRKAARAEMDPELRRSLTEELAPQVVDLGALIGRDLSGWSRA
ncbi:MAG: sulfotransferase family protein [Candidatus Limnocylindrales bacterium]